MNTHSKKKSKSAEIKAPTLLAPGYKFSGSAAGIKSNGKTDLALIFSEVPAVAVACFTTNRIKAAPVLQGQALLKKSAKLQAILVNSGNANAATGERGLKNAYKSAERVAKLLTISPDAVMTSSTGKIGVQLDLVPLLAALPQAVSSLNPEGLNAAAEAILTTDRFAKIKQFKAELDGKTYHITGIAKGAGMIEPNMATMLAYILTDASLPRALLAKLFRHVVDHTFNAISVDGDMSTNDTALMLANGVSGVKFAAEESPGYAGFVAGLQEVCQALAYMMVQDGEGAKKVVEIQVLGASSAASAKKIAYSIARSQLVKTSFFGEDPNWGRVLAAIGYAGEAFDPEQVEIYYGPIAVVRRGMGVSPQNEAKAQKVMQEPQFTLKVNLNQGDSQIKIWTSDLGYEYVKINAEYHT